MTKRQIDRALEQFRAGERDLYTQEGQKLYSDEEHERRYETLLAEFDREKDFVVAEADRTIEKAERTLALERVMNSAEKRIGTEGAADRGDDLPPEPQGPSQRRSWLYRFFFGP